MAEGLNYQINIQGNAAKSIGEIKKELKEANSELIAAQANFGEYSNEAIAAARRVAGLRDSIQEARETADLFDPGKKFQALSGSITAVAAGYSALQGAIGLVGTKNEELEKQLLKVQSALALSQGLSQIADSAKDFQRLAAVVKTQVVTAFSTLRGAIIATGVGALAVALGLVIANFEKVKKVVLNLLPGLGAVADFIGNLVNKVTDFIGVTSEAGRQTAKLIADNEKAIKEGNRFLELNADKYDEYTQRKIKANLDFKEKQNEFLKDEALSEDERNKLILQAREKANREIVKSDTDREANRKKVLDEAAKKNAELQKQREKEEQDRIAARNDRESAAQKVQIDAFRSTLTQKEQDVLQAEDELESKRSTLIRAGNFNFEKIEEEHRLKLAEINAKYDKQEEEKKKAVDEVNLKRQKELDEINAITLQEKRDLELQNLQDQYNKELLLAIQNGENVIALEELFAAKKSEINQKYVDLKKQQDDQILQAEVDLANAKFAAASAGLNLLGSLVGQNEKLANALFIVDKALAVAKIIVDTQREIAGYAANPVWTLFPDGGLAIKSKAATAAKIRAAASIATIGATTIAKFKGGAAASNFGSGGAINTIGTPIVPTQQAQLTQLNQASINAIGNQAIRAYVVETDITTNQQRVQAIKQRARFS